MTFHKNPNPNHDDLFVEGDMGVFYGKLVKFVIQDAMEETAPCNSCTFLHIVCAEARLFCRADYFEEVTEGHEDLRALLKLKGLI